MKRESSVSPVLLELVLVILFFAISSAAVLQLIAAAAETSRDSRIRTEALIAATDLMETAKADPLGEIAAEPVVTDGGSEITFSVSTAGTKTGAGTLYEIVVLARSQGETVLRLTGRQYVPGRDDG